MENEFTAVMSMRTDEELIKIVTILKDDYNPDAIKAAELEIKKREIDIQDFEIVKEKIRALKNNIDNTDTNIVNSGIRFLNFLIDSIAFIILTILITLIAGLFVQSTDQLSIQITSFILILGTYMGYYALMEIKFQKTIGKFITKTKVVKMDGEKPEKGEIITRTFCRLIPFDKISFLFTKNGFHDSFSGTTVIKDAIE